MKKPLKALRVLIPTFLFVATLAFFIVSTTQAATLAAVYVYLSRLKAGLNGGSGQEVQLILAIDTATTIPTGGTVKIEFPDDHDSTWCRTAGSLTVTAVTSSAVDLSGTTWQIDSGLPASGTLSAACTQGGVGTADTITISNVGELASGTTYGVRIESNVGVLGTYGTAGQHLLTITAASGGTFDSLSFEIDLLADDAVVITATVSALASIDCTISTNTVVLGTLYPGGTFATGGHTITTTTTANGYYWAVYGTGDGGADIDDAGLYKLTAPQRLLRSGADPTIDLRVAESEGFGLTLSQPTGATVPSSFSNSVLGVFGTIDRLYSGAKLVLYKNTTATSEVSDVTYGARAGIDAPAGSYQEIVYFICGAYY